MFLPFFDLKPWISSEVRNFPKIVFQVPSSLNLWECQIFPKLEFSHILVQKSSVFWGAVSHKTSETLPRPQTQQNMTSLTSTTTAKCSAPTEVLECVIHLYLCCSQLFLFFAPWRMNCLSCRWIVSKNCSAQFKIRTFQSIK